MTKRNAFVHFLRILGICYFINFYVYRHTGNLITIENLPDNLNKNRKNNQIPLLYCNTKITYILYWQVYNNSRNRVTTVGTECI